MVWSTRAEYPAVGAQEEVAKMKQVVSFPDFIMTLPEIDVPLPGARGWLLQGEGQQVAFLEFTETVDVPEHSHEEQWEFAIAVYRRVVR